MRIACICALAATCLVPGSPRVTPVPNAPGGWGRQRPLAAPPGFPATFQTFGDDGHPLRETLDAAEIRSVIDAIKRKGGHDLESFDEVDLAVAQVDLGDGPARSLIVGGRLRSPLCSAMANCVTAVFREVGSKWRLVSQVGLAAGFSIGERKHKGLKDIAMIGTAGGGREVIEVSEFNGTRYKRTACYVLNGQKLSVEKLSPTMGCTQ